MRVSRETVELLAAYGDEPAQAILDWMKPENPVICVDGYLGIWTPSQRADGQPYYHNAMFAA